MQAIQLGWKVLTRWDHFHILAVLVLAAEAAICAAAIRYVPCENALRVFDSNSADATPTARLCV
jgi:hypothetical protein